MKINPLYLLPPVLFLVLAGAFLVGLNREAPDELPSALAGKPAPELELPPLFEDAVGVNSSALAAPGTKLVNFWASWCGPCRVEHPMLEEIAADGMPIIGINYKDQPANAKAFLEELGDPYVTIGVDANGRTGIDWGLYGVPETFVIDGEGRVLLRHPGPITRRIWNERFVPLIKPQ